MKIVSPAYADDAQMPARFATINVAGGTGVSVPLMWDGTPAGTLSFVLTLIDIHPVARGWVHWLVTGIPAGERTIPEGVSGGPRMPAGSVEHPNTSGRHGYGGPQPPVGSGMHDYVASIYALDVPDLPLGPNATWDEVREAMAGHVLDSATLVGRFGR
jgi:Raf kinase inhibitor-like YbhB/YbcL family protein